MASTSKVTRLNIKMYFDILLAAAFMAALEIVKWVYSNLYIPAQPHSHSHSLTGCCLSFLYRAQQ